MKKQIVSIVVIIVSFIASVAWGASPAFENFKPGVFSRSGNTIQIAAGATNASGELIVTPSALAGGTNFIKGSSLVASNATYGSFGINTNNAAMPSMDGYNGHIRQAPATGKDFQVLFPGGGPQYDFWGNSTYFGLQAYDSVFRGFQFFAYGYPGTQNNLRDGDVAVSINSGAYGGSGASLQDLPISGHEIAPHIDGPMIALTTWNNSSESRILNQTNCWDQLRNFSTNGLLAALTNLGVKPYFHMDSNARWLTNTRVSSEMAINYTAFPDSTNYLRYWQTNGWKFTLTVYADKTPTNAYYVGLTGIQAAPGAVDSSPAMTPNSAARDVRTLHRWGFDQIRGSDMSVGVGYHHFWSRTIASLCLNPLGESWHSAYTKNSYSTSWALGRTNYTPMSFQWLTPHIGIVDPSVYTMANVVNHDWANPYPGYVSTGDAFLNWMNVFRAVVTNVVPHLSVGHYGVGPTFFADVGVAQTRLELATAAMTWGTIQISTPTNQMLSAFLPTAITNMTNSVWISTHQDLTGLQNGRKLIRLSDAGATNVSAWAKPLRGGEYAVLLVNEAGTAQNITFTAAQLGEPVSQTFSAYDIWNGTNTGFFSASHTINVASKDSYFLRVRPVLANTYGYAAVQNGDLARLSVASLSPSPSYFDEGLTIGAGAGSWRIGSIANMATNVTVTTKIQANAVTAWSNTIYGFYYSPAGRVICAQSNNVACFIGAANSASNWTFNVVFPATNAPKVIGVNLTASTNSGTRYLGPNLTIYQE